MKIFKFIVKQVLLMEIFLILIYAYNITQKYPLLSFIRIAGAVAMLVGMYIAHIYMRNILKENVWI